MKKHNSTVEGLIKRHPDGFGFLIPDDKEHPDVYIPRHSMNGAMSNDRVVARVEPERGGDRFRGEITRILQRSMRKLVGHFSRLNDQFGIIRDEGKGWGDDLRINLADSMDAQNGDLVAAEILTYPEEGRRFTGKIVEVLGDIEDPMNDIRRVVHAHNIPEEFPKDVVTEAARFGAQPSEQEISGRVDLRGKNLITIDGATAKDFDDAVLVEQLPDGFLLYVAIADVSHYVRSDTAIDKEAYTRGTSVYFPNFVIPMLPEHLSNGLCSLNPHVPRLCVVAEMKFDFSGTSMQSKFYEAVMESKARCTYGKAQEVVDGVEVPELAHVKETILRCADLAKVLMAKRFREGSLDLEIPETELQIDGAGNPVDVIRSERLFAHRLIEELMLAANVAVATFLTARDIPSLYRIHESPNELAIQLLEKYMTSFGGRTRFGGGKLQKKLTKALEEFGGKPESQVIHILTLRSMSQAKYSPDNVGHFGLGFDSYSHFTSPIRRYPDLIVHRLLKSQILHNSAYKVQPEEALHEAGTWLSACEQRSVKAERQLMGIKKARFMQSFIGKEFDGLVSSVTKFGAFILLREYDIDGLVRAEEMGDGLWDFDEENLALVARRSGFSIRVGDTMRVVVANADVSDGKVSFSPVEVTSSRKMQLQAAPPAQETPEDRPSTRRSEPSNNHRRDEKRHKKEGGRRDSPAKKAAREERRARKERQREKKRMAPPARHDSPAPQARKGPDLSRFEPKNLERDENRWKKNPGRDSEQRSQNSEKKGSGARSLMDVLTGRGGPALRERKFTRGSETQSIGKNSEERGSGPDDRGGVRKARVSQRGGKGSSGPIPRGKTQRKHRN